MSFTLPRPPRTDDELYWLIAALWGIYLPRHQQCENHVSPFKAVADAYFGRPPGYAVWYATRGSGKSLALAVLAATKAFIADADVTILGGSMTQSLNVRSHIADLMRFKNAPTYALYKNNATEMETTTGAKIRPIPASQTTVRGPHPPLSLLDEVDEMDYDIYEAAMGQAMAQVNSRGEVVNEYIVASSTWQNPEGTFTRIMEQARERGLPIYSWCWRELLEEYGGWMSQRFIDQKRATISEQMWKTEYDLNEPSGASRALDLDKVEEFFVPYAAPVERVDKGDEEQIWVFEKPQPAGIYAVGADWAKERDYTVISVVRYDIHPRRLVKLTRINRRPWPVMFDLFNKDVAAYNDAVSQHDKTGLGSVAQDFVDTDTDGGFYFIGRKRTQMLLDYITAFEKGGYQLPLNLEMPNGKNVLKAAHRSITVADVYAPGKWDTHLPDEFASISLAHRAAEKMPAPISQYTSRAEVKRTEDPVGKDFKQFQAKPYEGEHALRSEGGVTVVDERYDTFTDWFRD